MVKELIKNVIYARATNRIVKPLTLYFPFRPFDVLFRHRLKIVQ